jgi:hypothetical protein
VIEALAARVLAPAPPLPSLVGTALRLAAGGILVGSPATRQFTRTAVATAAPTSTSCPRFRSAPSSSTATSPNNANLQLARDAGGGVRGAVLGTWGVSGQPVFGG